MSIKDQLIKQTALAIKNGASVFSLADITSMLKTANRQSVAKIMHRACTDGIFINVAKGYYVSQLHSFDGLTIIYKIINRLRSSSINYISLESQLSHLGVISQIPIDRVTVVTTGRKGVFNTPFGVIELTHTKNSPKTISKMVYFDESIQMFRATKKYALADLKRTGRNIQMLESKDNA